MVPVSEGYILRRGLLSQNHGGEEITRKVLEFMESKATNPILPHFDYEYAVNNEGMKEANLNKIKGVTASMREYFKLAIAREAKEEFVRVLTESEEK